MFATTATEPQLADLADAPSTEGPGNPHTSLSNTPRKSASQDLRLATTDHDDEAEDRLQDRGIDTVALSFLVNPDLCLTTSDFWRDSSSRKRRESMPELEQYTGFLETEGGRVRVTLCLTRRRCWLYFNAARVGLPDARRWALLPPADLLPLVRSLLDALSPVVGPAFVTVSSDGELVWPGDWAEQVSITRLDIARNLLVDDPDVVKAVLPRLRCAYGKHSVLHNSGEDGWTLENKTKESGTDRLYGKKAQLDAAGLEERLAEQGGRLFRFEAQIQGDRLTTYGLSRLSTVTDETAWAALVRRWEATRWGSPLPSASGIYQAVKDVPLLQRERLLGFLLLAAIGATSDMSPSHVREFRAQAERLGLVPGMPVELQGPPDRCLDLEAGRLVPLVAVDEEAGSG